MKRLSILIFLFCLTLSSTAQSVRQQLKDNPKKSGGTFLEYQGPTQEKLTPAPQGKKACYISHYGRHGSRRMTKREYFQYVLDIFNEAERQNKLTLLGLDVKGRVEKMEQEATDRLGDLTAMGIQQNEDIVERMTKRFPEVFKGNATIDAKSTTSLRCIMSMTHAITHLKGIYPKMEIKHEASLYNMRHLFFIDKLLVKKASSIENLQYYEDFCNKYPTADRVLMQLFTDTTALGDNYSSTKLNSYLFRLASDIQDTDLRDKMTLYDLFTEEELYLNWKKENAFWYLGYGLCWSNGYEQPFSQRYLLRDVIEMADSCLRLKHPGVTLRYGHDTALLPFICLLGINNYGISVDDLDLLEEKGWIDFNAIPMAGNVQLIFYRKDINDKDVLFKVLLNENEATLPIKTDVAPYYHWNDFRDYYLKLINDYEKKREDMQQ